MDGDGDLDLFCGNFDSQQFLARNSLYLNQGTRFENAPAWLSEPGETTVDASLADVDGDGDPDLVYADGIAVRVHPNVGGRFSSAAEWSTPEHEYRVGVALGDVDGDGDLDLVAASLGRGPLRLYLNEGGHFGGSSVWASEDTAMSREVALGDVDGDGDLDLIALATPDRTSGTLSVYSNVGSSFTPNPVWTSGSSSAHYDLALADIDGDGLLDLAGGSVLYRNQGGGFASPEAWPGSGALGDVDGDGDLDLVTDDGLYLNDAGTVTPAWSHPLSSILALADVDGDGDLDLLSGGPQKQLFLNRRLLFDPASRWTGGEDTQVVALGDIDSDGDLDLVCGNGTQPATLHLNTDGGFEPNPSWASGPYYVDALALGDVDGDADLDAVFAGAQKLSLYLNEGGSFATTPIWTASTTDLRSLALGDVDGDGDLDLVCGNFYVEGNALYLNRGGTFSTGPDWQAPVDLTTGVDLGDVDGDGDLDLVASGHEMSDAKLYRNSGGTFGLSWESQHYSFAEGVELGDVDGDGDLDLVSGEGLYWNVGGSFGSAPPATVACAGTLEDLDGDGDLDLVCGYTYYPNDAGTFGDASVWTSEPGVSGYKLAIGDVDRDGDRDIVVGNKLFLNRQHPPYKFGADHPTHQLPNNDAFLHSVHIKPVTGNTYRILSTAVDVEADPVWILPEYAFRGTTVWRRMVVPGVTGLVGPLRSSAAGALQTFDWDATSVPLDPRPLIVRLRVLSNPQRAGKVQSVPAYTMEFQPRIRRPILALSDSTLHFQPVTLGDSVTVTLATSNPGNEPLTVFGVRGGSASLEVQHELPFEVAAGAAESLEVLLAPRTSLEFRDSLGIESNDPLAPVKWLQVVAEIRPLRFEARLLAPNPAPLGQAITALLSPEPGIHLESAALLYRETDSQGPFESLSLLPATGGSSRDFVGVIPTSEVTEAGFVYFFQVENSGVFATDPPDGGTLLQTVEAPAAISTLAEPDPETQGFPSGARIDILVSLPTGTRFQAGALHYRRAGELPFEVDSLRSRGQLFAASIPENYVGARGVQYYVEVRTWQCTLTDPPLAPESSPRSIRTTVRRLQEDRTHPALRYRMVSIPMDLGPGFQGTLASLLSDEPAFATSGPSQWRAFRYVADSLRTLELATGRESLFSPQPGRAFWLISRLEHRIDTAPATGFSTRADSSFVVQLRPGWNQFGNPFAFPVGWASVELPDSVGDLTAYDSNAGVIGAYSDSMPAVLQPFEGYFIYNASRGAQVLRIPPIEAPTGSLAGPSPAGRGRPLQSGSRIEAPSGRWVLRLRAKTQDAIETSAMLGTDPRATDGVDALDRRQPPAPPGAWVQVAFACDAASNPAQLRHDLRNPGSEGHAWEVVVRSPKRADEVVLDLRPEDERQPGLQVPDELAIRLVDRELGCAVDLLTPGGEARSYRLIAHGAQRPYRLTLLAGTTSYLERAGTSLLSIPSRIELGPNSPNPFNATTRLRFGLPEDSRVTLAIYNVRGEKVAMLLDDARLPAGYHVALWDGRNASGRSAASGVYVCRLVTGTTTLTRRLVLIK